jgi:hypothetical protein
LAEGEVYNGVDKDHDRDNLKFIFTVSDPEVEKV